jgi:hypothetical protein
VTSLIVGIFAFLSGLIPVWGFLVGTAALVLGVIALIKKQSKGLALTGIILGGLAALTSLLATVALIGGIATSNQTVAGDLPVAVGTSEPSESPTGEPTEIATQVAEPTQTPSPAAEETTVEPSVTVSQLNALGSAVSYLNISAFSRSGLIEQLEYEGYSKADATYAVDTVGANWKEQAAKSAENYLSFTSFSRSGLIDQLIFEGFSTAEATFGVDSVGL